MSLTSVHSNKGGGGLISSERLDIVMAKITRPFFYYKRLDQRTLGPVLGYSLFLVELSWFLNVSRDAEDYINCEIAWDYRLVYIRI